MSSEIMNALAHLDEAVENVEYSTGKQEHKVLQLKQQDLFASPVSAYANSKGGSMNAALVAKKLDSAIAHVEQLLESA